MKNSINKIRVILFGFIALTQMESCKTTQNVSNELESKRPDADSSAPLTSGVRISHSGNEVAYSYEVTFRSLLTDKKANAGELLAAAKFHAAHLYGLFHSPEMSGRAGYPEELIEGFSGTKTPTLSNIESKMVSGDEYVWVKYQANGSMIVLNQVLKKWLKEASSGDVELPLLKDLPEIYLDTTTYRNKKWQKCTDKTFPTAYDFSYFYTPFKCPELSTAPIAQNVKFKIRKVNKSAVNTKYLVPLAKLHDNNFNGNLTTLYFISGFNGHLHPGEDPSVIYKDDGYKNFQHIEKMLMNEHGFEKVTSLEDLRKKLGSDFEKVELQGPVHTVRDDQQRYFNTYVKYRGSEKILVRSALFNTDNETRTSPLRSFPKFWKEAWENGDFIYFGGHSGDGQSLSLRNMVDNLQAIDMDAIKFKRQKTQIAFFDSCSSYAHYQELYSNKLPDNLHLITFGLVSLFHLGTATIDQLVDIVLSDANRKLTWFDAIKSVEERQLQSHVSYYYGQYSKKDQQEVLEGFQKKKQVPTSLMSVSVAE